MNWQAKWIWSLEPNAYIYVRREIDIDTPLLSAVALVSCFSEYKLYINGRYIGRGPGPCVGTLYYYDEYDVTYALRSGKNVIAAICRNVGINISNGSPSNVGFLLQLETTYFDTTQSVEKKSTLATDENWKVRVAEEWDSDSIRKCSALGFQEVYDSRLKPVGWNVVGFDDSSWEQAIVMEASINWHEQLVPKPIPHLREREIFPKRVLSKGVVGSTDKNGFDDAMEIFREIKLPDPLAVRCSSNLLYTMSECAVVFPGRTAYLVLDFGKEVVGFPLLRIRDGGQCVIDLRYFETLDGEIQS